MSNVVEIDGRKYDVVAGGAISVCIIEDYFGDDDGYGWALPVGYEVVDIEPLPRSDEDSWHERPLRLTAVESDRAMSWRAERAGVLLNAPRGGFASIGDARPN